MNLKNLKDKIETKLMFTVWNTHQDGYSKVFVFTGLSDDNRNKIVEFVRQFYLCEFVNNNELSIAY